MNNITLLLYPGWGLVPVFSLEYRKRT